MELERSKARAEVPVGAADVQGKEGIVGRSPFASLEGDSRRALLDLGTMQRLGRRFSIAAQGEPPRSFVLIGSGRVKLERLRSERALPLGHRGPGQMVGETALGGAGAPLATESAIVVDDVEALSFPIAALRAQLAGDAALRAAMAAAIVRQRRAIEHRLEGLLLQGVEARLAVFLLEAVERWGRPHPEGQAISAPFTHAEIALLIGSTRETVTLVLGKLKRGGLVAFDRRRIILRDPAELARRFGSPEP
jgi:CRP/FNR family transcriptional regulator, cyclic AMP receptor protein